MFKLKILYPSSYAYDTADTRTAALSLELYTQLGIESYQSSSSTLEFDCVAHRTLAAMKLNSVDFELL